jgi:hypothetical protein
LDSDEKIEKALKSLCEDKQLEKAGFMMRYVKDDIGKFTLYFISIKMSAELGLRMGGKTMIRKGFESKFKEINAKVREVK